MPDGNGRTARLLTFQLLYQAGYEVGRYISLEWLFEQVKQSDYETLEASSQGWHEGRHDPHPDMIRAVLRQPRDEGAVLRVEGQGRGAKWRLVEPGV